MRCNVCGVDHPLDEIEPAFARPDAYASLDEANRRRHAKADGDLCRIDDPDGLTSRYFVRAVLPVGVEERTEPVLWGLWVEVGEASFRRVLDLWSDPDQASHAPLPGSLANRIPTYPDTIGLPCALHLTGPTTRPSISLPGDLAHPLAREASAGVTAHRVSEWIALIPG